MNTKVLSMAVGYRINETIAVYRIRVDWFPSRRWKDADNNIVRAVPEMLKRTLIVTVRPRYELRPQ